MEPYTQRKLNMRNFHFGCNGKDRFDEIQQYLRRLTDAAKDSAHHVIIDIAKQQLAVNATVLSALSSYWRNLINENAQDSPVIYKISPVISHGPILLLPLIRLLIYVGNVSVPIKYIKDITTILRELHLEVSDFAVTNTGSEVECLTWENHFGHFMKGLQIMCNKQECTDLSIFVDSHVIKVHKLVLSSYSEVIKSLFEENNKIKVLHLPGASLKSAHTLVGYMYYGKGMIPSANIEEFSKLCKSMQVSRLTNILQMQQSETKIHDRNSGKKGNVFITVEPEIALVVKRLLMLFDVKGKTDLTLVVGNKRIYTHKSLLGMTCPVFHTVLMEEHSNEQSAVLISDADPISVTAVITLLYNGSCFITRAQMKLAASFLDPGLFKLHMSGDMSLQTDSRAEPTGSVDSNEGLLWHSENKLSSPQRRVILQDGNRTPDIMMEKHEVDEDVQLSESRQKLCVAGPRIESRSGQVDGMNCDDTLPKKRKRRSKLYNCDEWVTEESERGAAVVGKCPTGSDKILSSKSRLKGHMKAHIGESLSDTTVSKACKNSVTSATSCNRVKSCKGKKCRFCKRYFYGKGLEQHIKLKHSHKETEECSSNDVTEEGIQCMEDKDISTTQNLPSDRSKILNNKKQNLVTFYKNSSPQKFKGNKVDPDKLSEDSSLCWTCDLCDFQCSTYKSLLQHVSDFHAKDRKEDICEPTVSHLGEPFKSVTANEFQPDKSDSFVCPECGEIFSSVEKFSAHAEQKGHGSLHGSCWICGICEAAFFEENELNEHLVLHSAVVDDVPRSDNEERPVTILNQETTSDVNRCLVSVDEVSKNKYTSNDKIEPDSSVLDSDHLVQYEQFKNNLNSTYETEMNAVSSSVTNEKACDGTSLYSQVQKQLDQIFGEVE